MQVAIKCPYCGVLLRQGKGGNTRGCLVCEQLICTNCTRHGVCKTHISSIDPQSETKYRQNYQLYMVAQTMGILIPLIVNFYITFFIVIPDKFFWWYLLGIFSLYGLIIINVVIIRKIFLKRTKKISQSDPEFEKKI